MIVTQFDMFLEQSGAQINTRTDMAIAANQNNPIQYIRTHIKNNKNKQNS